MLLKELGLPVCCNHQPDTNPIKAQIPDMSHVAENISECLWVQSSSWWNQHSSAFSADPAQQLKNFNCCPATALLSRKVSSGTGDTKLSHSCTGENQGIWTGTAWATQQGKTACRELWHWVLQMWEVKDTYTPMCTLSDAWWPQVAWENWHREGSERYARRSQLPSWELIWGSPVPESVSPGSQMMPVTRDRLWDTDPAHRPKNETQSD